jgi:predicted nucleotidyltransferase
MYGLLDRDIKFIIKALKNYIEIDKAVIFGSRAIGNYKKGSDIDLAIFGEKIDRNIIIKLNDDLNEKYPLPYFFDIINYNDISNKELKDHIDNLGKLIYNRG